MEIFKSPSTNLYPNSLHSISAPISLLIDSSPFLPNLETISFTDNQEDEDLGIISTTHIEQMIGLAPHLKHMVLYCHGISNAEVDVLRKKYKGKISFQTYVIDDEYNRVIVMGEEMNGERKMERR
eukprot:TRINITY_DN2086_c0_g5_i3.p2 TRINITY_DN2086_c0_g5~~TRINITY_DN2086_c0_g5_i3.p2  ORF type:complete len:125 (-),score=26.00 TRINITY_DN2086_c0_g5_i3:126-500(-)